MKLLISATSALVLMSSSAYASSTFYCADDSQDVQFNEDQALITINGRSTSYALKTEISETERTYVSHKGEVTIRTQDAKVVGTEKRNIGLCVDGVQKVMLKTQTSAVATVEVEDMAAADFVVTCETKEEVFESCN